MFPTGNWLPLYSYNHQFYLYYPCDFGTNTRYKISQESIIEYGFEEVSLKFIKATRINSKEFNYKLLNPGTGKIIDWTFHLIDNKKGIAVLETGPKHARNFRLLVSAKLMKEFPMIVHECNVKSDEFKFEDPNFRTLLENRKQEPKRK